jgi:hypothetical protein
MLIDSLFESETLTPESLGGVESSLRDFGSLFFLSFGAFLSIVFGIFKESLPSEWYPFLLNSLEYKLDERVL